jgi:pyruvate,orthophosphate dikinase
VAKPGSHSKALLGGKGANLAGMSELGLSVPPGFTITTEVCSAFHRGSGGQEQKVLPAGVWEEILKNIVALEKTTGKGFGSSADPLLVSVRSGAAISMPGMMDTILNLGLNDETVMGLASHGGDRFAWVRMGISNK